MSDAASDSGPDRVVPPSLTEEEEEGYNSRNWGPGVQQTTFLWNEHHPLLIEFEKDRNDVR